MPVSLPDPPAVESDGAPSSSVAPGSKAWLRQHSPKVLLSLVIAAGFVWMFRRGGLPLLPNHEIFAKISWWTLPVSVFSQVLATHLRTYRWVYLLRPLAPAISGTRTLGMGLIGFTAILFAPLRMGEIARPYLVSLDGKVSFTQAVGTVGAERVIDGLVVTVALFLAMLTSTPLSPLPDRLGRLPLPVAAVPAATYSALLLFSCAFAAMALFYWARHWARRFTFALIGPISEPAAIYLTRKIERLAEGLSFLPRWQASAPFLRDTLLYWLTVALGQWATMRGCGVPASLGEAWVTVGITGLGTLIPAGPGFFGAYQLSAYCGLATFFPEEVVLSSGAAFVFVSYATQLAVTLLSCFVGFILMSRSK